MRPTARRLAKGIPLVGLSGALLAGLLSPSGASSHREAPLSSQDPVSDLTDVFAFRSPDAPDTLTLAVNALPFADPAGGPNFYKFGDDVKYRINVDNDGDAVADRVYEFDFRTRVTNPDTFLYNTNVVESLDDEDLNVRQTYTLYEYSDGGRRVLGSNLPVAPANVGQRSTPNYEDNLGQPAVQQLGDTGIRSFAGPRDDPFFIDLGAIFDLGGLRPFNDKHLIPKANEPGKDGLAGYGVMNFSVQVPIEQLTQGDEPVVGVWASTLRRRMTTRTPRTGVVRNRGRFTEVSRLGMPLVNEVVIPLRDKDRWNASRPRDDAQFLEYVTQPELGGLIELLYPGVDVPEEVDAGIGTGGREDLVAIFLTGIPDVNQPANVVPSEMLRINTAAETGFPNGRLLTDDVTDIEIQAVAGNTAFTPEYNRFPNNALGDGVRENDKPFLGRFPYLAPTTDGYTAAAGT